MNHESIIIQRMQWWEFFTVAAADLSLEGVCENENIAKYLFYV